MRVVRKLAKTHQQPFLSHLGALLLAVENDATLNALAVEAFNDLLKKHGKRQSVENPLLD